MASNLDVLNLAYSIALLFLPFIIYILLTKDNRNGRYSKAPWYSFVKKIISRNIIKKFLRNFRVENLLDLECPMKLTNENEEDVHMIYGTDQEGNSIYIKFATRLHKFAEVSLQLRLSSGEIFQLPNEPEVLVCSIRNRQWKTKELSIDCLEPQKIYRITYNGFMKQDNSFGHLRFNMIWIAASAPLFYPGDYSSGLFSDAISREPWRDGDWLKLLGDRAGYDQYGCLYGIIQGSSIQGSMKKLNIPTVRKRYVSTADKIICHRDLGVFICTEDGTLINVGSRCLRNGCTHLRYGSVLYSNGDLKSITKNDIDLEYIGEYGRMPRAFMIHLKTKRSHIKCVLHVHKNSQATTFSDETRGWTVLNLTAECDVDLHQGRALITSWYSRKGKGIDPPPPLLREIQSIDNDMLIVALNNEECRSPEVSGTNGASLALLSSLHSETFTIPETFVLTTRAFWRHIEQKDQLRSLIMQMVLNSQDDKKLEEICEEVVNLFTPSSILEDVTKAILLKMSKLRSQLSRSGEDSLNWAVYSASESNDNNVVCKSVAEVLAAVTRIWASIYSYENVKKRRHDGDKILCDVAIIVQRKIIPEAQGTLYPYESVNADCSRMILDFVYGLEKDVFPKHRIAILERSYNGKVKLKQLNENVRNLGITDEVLTELGNILITIEERFGAPQIINWAFSKGKIYILQIQEVNLQSGWTDNELEHELDDPIRSEREIYTKENVKEVMPDALTVLSSTVIRSIMSCSWEKIIIGRTNRFVNLGFVSIYHHTFINVLNIIWRAPPEAVNINTLIIDLVMFGYPVTSELVKERAIERNGRQNVMSKMQTLRDLMFFAFISKHSYQKIPKLSKIDIAWMKDMTLRQEHESIEDFTKIVEEIAKIHYVTWRVNIIYHLMTMMLLIGNDKECTTDHYHDIALIFSSSKNVISAEIPKTIEHIAVIIRNSGKAETFAKLTTAEAPHWLEEHIPEAFKFYNDFLKQHGHRAFREYELMEQSWSSNQEVLISAIQKISSTEQVPRARRHLTVDETIRKLKTRKGYLETEILRFLVKKCRSTITRLEHTKSELTKAIDKLRYGYRSLAKRMVSAGHLPKEDLVFHLTKYEVKKLTEGRDPKLVAKAYRREELYEVWNQYKLDDWLFMTYPTDLHQVENKIQGIPICLSDVTTRCCCISSTEDADDIQSGDILITHSVDIRWYPYFPMLSAIVVESGGLISHGIVAAREFGLPCLTGVKDATKIYKTGDFATISARNGTLQRVST